MKRLSLKIPGLLSGLLFFIFLLPGCYETHYYHHYHHHTRPWYERRHEEPPSGINFEMDVYKRGGHRDRE